MIRIRYKGAGTLRNASEAEEVSEKVVTLASGNIGAQVDLGRGASGRVASGYRVDGPGFESAQVPDLPFLRTTDARMIQEIASHS